MANDLNYWKSFIVYEEMKSMLEAFKRFEEKSESPIETIAMIGLMRLREMFGTMNVFVYQQEVIETYRVDLLVVYRVSESERIRIIVECDGHEFHEKTKQQAAKDKARDRELTKLGYKVLRYTGSELCECPTTPVLDIIEIIRPGSTKKHTENGGQNGA